MVFLLVGVPVSMIYIGLTTVDYCPAEPMIPIYLLVTGSFSIFRTIWYCLEFWLMKRRIGMVLYDLLDTIMCISTAFMATIYLFGLYWVLHIVWPNMEDQNAFNYCDPVTYIFAFVTVVGILILVVFWCMCVCVLAFQVVPVVNEEIYHIGIPVSLPPQANQVTIAVVETTV